MTALEFEFEMSGANFSLSASAKLDAPVTGVFGPSGAGKSTFLNCLAGLARPTSGYIRIGDELVFDSKTNHFTPPHQRGVGFVFQDRRLFPHLNVKSNLRFANRAAASESKLKEVADLFELAPLLDRRPATLSGGEQQRVALARALLSNPRILLLDEPLVGLDHALRAQIIPYLKRLREATGVPLLYVSHDLSEILQQTRQLLLIESGRTTASGDLLSLVQSGKITHGNLDNVLPLKLDHHDTEAGLSLLATKSKTQIAGSLVAAEPGQQLHVGLRPEDIVLALDRVDAISTRNQLPGEVRTLINEGARVLALVDVGVELLVEVSPSAVQELDLKAGRQVVCLFKANALRYLDSLPAAK